jgi:hypothetical protein
MHNTSLFTPAASVQSDGTSLISWRSRLSVVLSEDALNGGNFPNICFQRVLYHLVTFVK